MLETMLSEVAGEQSLLAYCTCSIHQNQEISVKLDFLSTSKGFPDTEFHLWESFQYFQLLAKIVNFLSVLS